MNKNEIDIGETCSLKLDGHIKYSTGQIHLAHSAIVGRVFLAAYLSMKLMNSH